MTFRPGQKVRIKDSVTVMAYPEVGDYFAAEMLKYKGKVYTIKEICYNNVYLVELGSAYNWYDIWFEPAYTIIHTKAII